MVRKRGPLIGANEILAQEMYDHVSLQGLGSLRVCVCAHLRGCDTQREKASEQA